MTDLFEESIAEINNFYKKNGYQIGWRFLNGSKKTLVENPSIALITLNPGGDTIPKDHPWESCENGSSYLHEKWGNSASGQNNLQKQIQLMFEKIINSSNLSIKRNDLIEQSLTGYFIPFRSPRLADLINKKEAFEFGTKLWKKILTNVRPKLFICMDKDTHKSLRPIISSAYNLDIKNSKKIRTGWGDYTAELDSFGENAKVQLLRLPHLSTFKLFTSVNCANQLNIIFNEACLPLRRDNLMEEKNIFDNDNALDFIMSEEIDKQNVNQVNNEEKEYIVSNIERIEETEINCGINIDGANAIYDGPYLDGNMHAVVNAEIKSRGGAKIKEDFHIIGSAFDKNGKILTSAAVNFKAKSFFAIAPLKLHLSVMEKPAKIRIYAQKGASTII